jgi:hypothetical protein
MAKESIKLQVREDGLTLKRYFAKCKTLRKKESGCFFTLILKETLLAKLIYAKSLVLTSGRYSAGNRSICKRVLYNFSGYKAERKILNRLMLSCTGLLRLNSMTSKILY